MLFLAQIPQHIRDTATDIAWVIGVIAGILTGLAIIAKSPLGRVLARFLRFLGRAYRRAFGAPFTAWFRKLITDAVRGEIDVLRAENTEQHAHTSKRLDDVVTAVDDVDRRVALMERHSAQHGERLDRGAERMSDLAAAVADLATHLTTKEHIP